jgi:hypothetical protein
MKFTWMIRTSFAVTELFYHRISVIFNTLFTTMSKTLYTNVAKFPASTSEHLRRT